MAHVHDCVQGRDWKPAPCNIIQNSVGCIPSNDKEAQFNLFPIIEKISFVLPEII